MCASKTSVESFRANIFNICCISSMKKLSLHRVLQVQSVLFYLFFVGAVLLVKNGILNTFNLQNQSC